MAAKRPVSAVYYSGKKVVRRNHGAHPRTMVLHALDHLQLDHYSAQVVEVFDHTSGTLHAVLTRNMRRVVVVYKRNPTEHQ